MKNLFTNDKFFGGLSAISVLCLLYYVAQETILQTISFAAAVFAVLEMICVSTLFVSYKNHSKNVMKGMMGSLLIIGIVNITLLVREYERVFDTVLSVVCFVLSVAIFINHFIINSDRHSRNINIVINQILALLIGVLTLFWDIMWIPVAADTLHAVSSVVSGIGCACISAVVVCVESRLDAYRLDREAAGWSEEKGYPEGYVHEYQKK